LRSAFKVGGLLLKFEDSPLRRCNFSAAALQSVKPECGCVDPFRRTRNRCVRARHWPNDAALRSARDPRHPLRTGLGRVLALLTQCAERFLRAAICNSSWARVCSSAAISACRAVIIDSCSARSVPAVDLRLRIRMRASNPLISGIRIAAACGREVIDWCFRWRFSPSSPLQQGTELLISLSRVSTRFLRPAEPAQVFDAQNHAAPAHRSGPSHAVCRQ